MRVGVIMYYRISCENIGIYEYLKEYIFKKYKNPKKSGTDFLILNVIYG